MNLGTTAAAAATTKLAEGVFDSLKKAAGDKWKALRNESLVGRMATRLNSLRMVKTIWEPDRPVDLVSFYVPGKIETGEGRQIVESLADLPTVRNLTIQGTVGLGKSMLMRWFVWREVGYGNRVPIFVELRRVSKSRTVWSAVIEEMQALGLHAEPELFTILAGEGKLVLLLDGFDEVTPDIEQDVTNDIEDIARRNPRLQIVVSTRPDSAACHFSGFSVCSLSLLQNDEYKDVLRKLESDSDTVSSITKALKDEESEVQGLLTTPLMVALLVLKYRTDYEVPENELAFYDGLFDLLARKHDRSKSGFRRNRSSGLSNHDMNEAFDAFSYLSRKDGLNSFTRREAHDVASRALRRTSRGTDAEAFVTDIVDVTCLVLFDADEGRFVHRSVQEFHAASYIARLPDEPARQLYAYLVEHWVNWQQEIRFLPMLDKSRFTELFAIPMLKRLCDKFANSISDEEILDSFLEAFGSCEVGFGSDGEVDTTVWTEANDLTWFARELLPYLTQFVQNVLSKSSSRLPSDGSEAPEFWLLTIRKLAEFASASDSRPLVEFVFKQRNRLSEGQHLVTERYKVEDLLPE